MPNTEIPKLEDYSPQALDHFFLTIKRIYDQDEAQCGGVPEKIEELRIRWVGRKQGHLKSIGEECLKTAPIEAKKAIGQRFNQLKEQIEQALDAGATSDAARAAGRSAGPITDSLDITLPGIRPGLGAEHPLIKTLHEVVGIFERMGYSVGVGPEVETDYYNFESLNFPPNHPARDTQDTLVVAAQEKKPLRERLLLRTHTSPVQIRTMEQQPPPLRIVIPGKVHRNDAADATHSPIFHQVEGLCVDTNITFSDLKGTLDHAMKELFGSSVQDALLSVVLSVHGAERRRADQLHLLRAARAAANANTPAGLSCWAAAWSIRQSLDLCAKNSRPTIRRKSLASPLAWASTALR